MVVAAVAVVEEDTVDKVEVAVVDIAVADNTAAWAVSAEQEA